MKGEAMKTNKTNLQLLRIPRQSDALSKYRGAAVFFSRSSVADPSGNLAEVVTDPTGGGWFDRYGLENAAKCVGQFGTTYLTANGARANLRLGRRDYLIQQNWVNDRKGHCAMNQSL
jgi:hypothetical protein